MTDVCQIIDSYHMPIINHHPSDLTNQSQLTTDHKEVSNKGVYCHAIKEAETALSITLQRLNRDKEEVGGLMQASGRE